ncbi:hypothetical protein ACYULU_04885 [Breznakiellaceae bacterium SP9]
MKIKPVKRIVQAAFIMLLLQGQSAAALANSTRQIVDDSALRRLYHNILLTELPQKALQFTPQIEELAGGGQVLVQVKEDAARNEFSIIFARELGETGNFPAWSKGTWILTRDKRDGKALKIQVFLRNDENTYIQFRYLSENKCLFDQVIYDSYYTRSLPIAIPFERLYTAPLEEVLALVGEKFTRRYFEPDPDAYREVRFFADKVRARIDAEGLEFGDDGAIDEQGRYVYIKDGTPQNNEAGLNCSGFSKWVVDGILWNQTKSRLPIAPLKEPFGDRGSNFSAAWEALRDPFFGLDWTRNLASIAAAKLRSPAFSTLEEIEVRDWHFSSLIQKGNPVAYPGFHPNSGFGIEGLIPLLYALAIDEPGRIFLAAVNEERGAPVTPDNLRGIPRMREYFHIGVLVPYFNEAGRFEVRVFESAEETAIRSFINHPGRSVNLVRIPIQAAFY